MSVTSEFYLARAAECARDAQNTTLDNVRDRFRRSEAVWVSMAERLTRGEEMRDEHARSKATREEVA